MESKTKDKDSKSLRWAVFICIAIVLAVLLVQLIRASSTLAQAEILTAVVIVCGLIILSVRVFDISSLTLRKDKLVAKLERRIDETEGEVQTQKSLLDEHRDILDRLIIFSMSGYIFGHLDHILDAKNKGEPYTVQDIEKVRDELKFLKDHGYIEDFNPGDIAPGRNIADVIRLTDIAEWFVRFRFEAEKREKHPTRQSSGRS